MRASFVSGIPLLTTDYLLILMKYLLATKQEMTQYFSDDGKCTAATLLSAGPVTVTLVRTKERDGYEAVQVGFGTQLPKRVNKPQRGALKELGYFRFMREYRPKKDGIDRKSVV